jgi:hypothetical protein
MFRVRRQFVAFAIAILHFAEGGAVAQISDLPDSVIEDCLTEGRIGKKVDRIHGVTRPLHLAIDCASDVDSVVFKSVDDHRRGLPAKVGGFTEMNFSDSYRYERAAYLLDRELGLNMVPVAVIREVRRTEGVLVAWIPNTTHEHQMTKLPTGQQLADVAQRKAQMGLFDALIFNVDRRPENWLIDRDTWELYMIDHSRAFRIREKLPEAFTSKRARVTQPLYEALEALNETRLSELLGDLIGDLQIRALLIRRDLILEKIDADCDTWGREAVFTDWQHSPGIGGDVAKESH